MRTSLIIASLTLACGLTSQARADVLAGGPLYAAPSQKIAVCYFFNAGNEAVILKNFWIADQSGIPGPLTVNECGQSPVGLAPGKSCGIAIAASKLSYSCRVSIPDKEDVRGTLELRDGNQVVLQNVELR